MSSGVIRVGTGGGLLLMALYGFAWFASDEMHACYATLAQARAAGALERGWLPRELPPSAREICESHNLDSNRGEGEFRFAVADAGALRAALAAAAVAGAGEGEASAPEPGYSVHLTEEFVLYVNGALGHARFELRAPRDRGAR